LNTSVASGTDHASPECFLRAALDTEAFAKAVPVFKMGYLSMDCFCFVIFMLSEWSKTDHLVKTTCTKNRRNCSLKVQEITRKG
jgi:hypothetical protein